MCCLVSLSALCPAPLLTYLFSSHPSHLSFLFPPFSLFTPFAFLTLFFFFFLSTKTKLFSPFSLFSPYSAHFLTRSVIFETRDAGGRGSWINARHTRARSSRGHPHPLGRGSKGGGVNSQSSTPLGAGQSRPLTLSPPKSNNNSMRNNDHTLPSPRGLSSPSSLGPSGSPRMTQSSTAALAHDPTSTGGGGGMALTGNHRVTPQVPTHPRIHPLMHPVLSPHICPLIHTSYILRAHPRISQSPDNHRLISS